MSIDSILRAVAAAGLAALLAACSTAEPTTAQLPIAPIGSVEEADRRLAAVAAETAAIEARYAEREAVCYDKFFVNNCLDEAKERRRAALAAQRTIEIDAERYKRQVKVEERDREIAKAEEEYKAEEARFVAEPPPPRAAQDLPPPRPRSSGAQAARQQQRAREAGQEKLSAQERAANVREFEERKRKSEERQKEVARRKAEREAKAARRAEEEAKKNGAVIRPGQ